MLDGTEIIVTTFCASIIVLDARVHGNSEKQPLTSACDTQASALRGGRQGLLSSSGRGRLSLNPVLCLLLCPDTLGETPRALPCIPCDLTQALTSLTAVSPLP